MAKKSSKRYVLCVNNRGYAASLERCKVYVCLPDSQAEKHGMIRVIDESKEDYLFPVGRFVAIDVPASARRAFADVA
jgi:hypothetical protein